MSTQGEISAVLDAVPDDVLTEMAATIRRAIGSHPAGSTCECPAIDALRVLMRTHRIEPR